MTAADTLDRDVWNLFLWLPVTRKQERLEQMANDEIDHQTFERHARDEAIRLCWYEQKDFEKLSSSEQADWLERARQKLRRFLAELAEADAGRAGTRPYDRGNRRDRVVSG
jgi:hypothetical protein